MMFYAVKVKSLQRKTTDCLGIKFLRGALGPWKFLWPPRAPFSPPRAIVIGGEVAQHINVIARVSGFADRFRENARAQNKNGGRQLPSAIRFRESATPPASVGSGSTPGCARHRRPDQSAVLVWLG